MSSPQSGQMMKQTHLGSAAKLFAAGLINEKQLWEAAEPLFCPDPAQSDVVSDIDLAHTSSEAATECLFEEAQSEGEECLSEEAQSEGEECLSEEAQSEGEVTDLGDARSPLPGVEEESDADTDWGDEVIHKGVSYKLAPFNYHAHTGSGTRSTLRRARWGRYILRCAEAPAGAPIGRLRNLARGTTKDFVKASGLRISNKKLYYKNISASGVVTERPIDYLPSKWTESYGEDRIE